MFRSMIVASLFAFAAVPALAVDPAAVAEVEKHLRDDEKSLLAAVLLDRAAGAEFEADVKEAAGDPKVMKLVLDKWRGRAVQFAESDKNHPTPDLEGTYKNYGAMLTPQIKAYLLRRLKTMQESDRNALIEYLQAVNDSLADDGKLSWYTKKVVSGIFDKYRSDLADYLATPFARDGKTNGPAAEQALAARRGARNGAAEQAERERLAREQAAREQAARDQAERERLARERARTGTDPKEERGVTISTPPVVETKPVPGDERSQEALEQARRAAELAGRSGAEFDGNTRRTDDDVPGVAAGGNTGSNSGGLTKPSGDAVPNLTAEVPSPEGEDEFMSSIDGMKTGSPLQPRKYLPAGAGALLGGLIGFFLGGIPGMLIGAGLGIIAGDQIGKKLFS